MLKCWCAYTHCTWIKDELHAYLYKRGPCSLQCFSRGEDVDLRESWKILIKWRRSLQASMWTCLRQTRITCCFKYALWWQSADHGSWTSRREQHRDDTGFMTSELLFFNEWKTEPWAMFTYLARKVFLRPSSCWTRPIRQAIKMAWKNVNTDAVCMSCVILCMWERMRHKRVTNGHSIKRCRYTYYRSWNSTVDVPSNTKYTMVHQVPSDAIIILCATMIRSDRNDRWSIGTKGPKVCQENIPHTITPPPPAWTSETRQDGSMLSFTPNSDPTSECCSRNQDSSDQATFFQSSVVQFWWSCVNCILRVLFLSDRSGTGVVFCCWSPSASGFDVLCVQRWYSADLGCNEWLFELLLSFYHL